MNTHQGQLRIYLFLRCELSTTGPGLYLPAVMLPAVMVTRIDKERQVVRVGEAEVAEEMDWVGAELTLPYHTTG